MSILGRLFGRMSQDDLKRELAYVQSLNPNSNLFFYDGEKVKAMETVVECPDWTADDVGALRKFLSTPTGINFLAKSRSMINALALAGCADMFHTTHSAGVAHGANEMLRCQASWAEIKFQESEPVKPENSATDELNAVDHAAKRAF